MSLKYWILILFVIAVCSRSSAQFCMRSYVDGKWISEGDCGGAEMMSDIMRDLQRRSEEEEKWTAEEEKKKCTVGNSGNSGKCNIQENYCEHHPNVCQHNGTCLNNNTHPYYSCYCTDGYYGKNCSALVRSCEDAQSASARASGVIKLDIPEIGLKKVFQRRMNGAVDFYRGWNDYVKGFGDLQGDHWLGLEALHQLTKTGNMELRIRMITTKEVYWVANYSSFSIGPGSDKHRLHVAGYSGNATYYALIHNRRFTTKDADHDGRPKGNCASHREGAWWYNDCGKSNLNGNFNKTEWQ